MKTPDERILDACAAPGGKSTLLRSILKDEDFLLSNEIVPKRASILFENIQKWGHENITDLDEGSKTYKEIIMNDFIIGEYSECIDTIVQYEQLGISEICCLTNFGSPDLEKVEKSLRLTAKNIMPYFY